MSVGNNINVGLNKDSEPDDYVFEVDQENLNTQSFCVIEAGGEQYAISIDLVKEVVKMPVTTPIPQMPSYFSSMANVRGEVYGILDISDFFQDISQDYAFNYLLIINDEEYRVAIALNNVPKTLKIEEKRVEELSSTALGSLKGKKYLNGIVKLEKQMVILFDVKGMIASQNFTEIIN